VAGVVANARLDDMISDPYPEMYLAALQTPDFTGEDSNPIALHMEYITLVLRGDRDPAELTRQARQAVRSFDRNLPVSQVLSMDEGVANVTAQPRFEMILLGLFGAVATYLGGNRHLWCYELLGVPTYARDRDPDVFGR
jgi:hypothetical protein